MTFSTSIRRAIVVLIGVASLLPVADLIPSGPANAGYADTMGGWLSGVAIVVGGGFLLAMLSERVPLLWRAGMLGRLLGAVDPISTPKLLGVAAAATTVYAAIALLVFDALPLHIDEIVQAYQARMYVAGRTWLPVPTDPALTSIMHLVEYEGRRFGHFPPGGPLWLMVGEFARAPWIAVPLAGGLSVMAWGLLLRLIEARASIRAGALILFALAPMSAFLAGSHMNHTTVLMAVLFGAVGLLGMLAAPDRIAPALLTGAAFGFAAIVRPADALAWGAPAGIWLLHAARGDRRLLRSIGAAVLAGLVPLAVAGWIQVETTGSPFQSAYALLWGPNVGLGFHPAPWGPDHTVVRGLELVAIYLYRLNVYLLEFPIPSLLPGLIALLLAPRLAAPDRYLLVAVSGVLVLYFAYWFDGFYLGPRFMATLAPIAALWTARLPMLVAARMGEGRLLRSVGFGLGLSVVLAAATGVPIRVTQHSRAMQPMRWSPDRLTEQAGLSNAVILVRESWGAQTLARLWALGVSRTDAERMYRNIDTCVIDGAIQELEVAPVGPDEVLGRLLPLQADSARLIASPLSPDTTERALPGAQYGARCIERFSDDRQGFAVFPPALLSRRQDLVFVRDLQERSAAAVRAHTGRAVYLFRRKPDADRPTLEAVSRDSILSLAP